MKQEEFYLEMLHRIDIIIALQLTTARAGKVASVTERILHLAELGLAPGEIGRLVGRKGNYVSAVLGSKRPREAKERNA